MIFLYFIRYFSIININENKMEIYRNPTLNKHVDKLIVWKMKILKWTSSGWFTISLLVISYALVVVALMIALIPNNFECKFDNLTAIKTIHNVLLIIIYFGTIMTFIIDMISNYASLIRCQWISYIFLKDPYYFRFQIVLSFHGLQFDCGNLHVRNHDYLCEYYYQLQDNHDFQHRVCIGVVVGGCGTSVDYHSDFGHPQFV
jgi:hypothetical protein